MAVRVVSCHPERQGSPTATQFENRLAISQLGVGCGLAERKFLGLIKGTRALRVEAATVFALRAEDQLEEFCWHLIVLRVGLIGQNGNRTLRHLGHEAADVSLEIITIVWWQRRKALLGQLSDSKPD